MLNLDFLYNTINSVRKDYLVNGKAIIIDIKNDSNVFNADYLLKVLSNMKKIREYKIKKLEIIIRLYGSEFGDEAVVLYFELIIYDLLKHGFKKIKLNISNITSNSYNYRLYELSRLSRFINKKTMLVNGDKFINDFENECILDKNHGYRIKFPRYNNDIGQILIVSKNDGDICIPSYTASFMKKFFDSFYFFGKRFKRNIVMLISEIVDNSISHTDSDCIISYKHYVVYNNEKCKNQLMISLAIANFSDNLIYSNIKDGLLNKNLSCGSKECVYEAYENSKGKFDDEYDIDFFSLISAFQKNVTTRDNAMNSSGRGLTKFLEYILSFSELDQCYVYSGKKLLWFKKKYIHVSEGGFVGFNESNDYLNNIPNKENLTELSYENNGTLFNLKLIYDWSDLIE